MLDRGGSGVPARQFPQEYRGMAPSPGLSALRARLQTNQKAHLIK
jgi:hypothetical protein